MYTKNDPKQKPHEEENLPDLEDDNLDIYEPLDDLYDDFDNPSRFDGDDDWLFDEFDNGDEEDF